jgi:hypothetical protein
VVLVRGPKLWVSHHAGSPSNCRWPRKPAGPTAPLVVRATYRDGTSAAGVYVSAAGASGRTAADGSVRLDAVPVGRCDVLAHAHGFLASVGVADVGRDAEVAVRESAPRTVRVEVVDEAGVPRPGAWVSAQCKTVPGVVAKSVSAYGSVAQIEGDVERLDPMTGRGGIVSLTAPVGTVEYRASLGGADGRTESSADSVLVVLVAPKD